MALFWHQKGWDAEQFIYNTGKFSEKLYCKLVLMVKPNFPLLSGNMPYVLANSVFIGVC